MKHFSLPGMLLSHDSIRGAYGMRHGAREPIFQMDATLGAPAALNEMLMQDAGGVIRLFPALPRGRNAAFRTLRAPGGILVSAAREGGQVRGVELDAECATEVRLVNPWPGAAVRVSGAGRGARVLKGAILAWPARRGGRYRVTPLRSA